MSQMNDLIMPKLGLTMTEGLLSEWCVSPGDSVNNGDVLYVVETDKVATEVTAHDEGTIEEIVTPVGETVPVGAVVARWTGPGQGQKDSTDQSKSANAEGESAPASIAEQPTRPLTTQGSSVRVVATPLARRLAREHAVELHDVVGSGPQGRIKAADVRATAQWHQDTPKDAPAVAAPAAERQAASGLVQSMARRMVEAKQVPHFYLAAEAEVSELLALRARLNDQEEEPKLTLNHFVLTAVVRALEAMPQQNRIWEDGELVQFQDIDVGIAVSSERGLLAPVAHDLGGCSLDEVAAQSNALVGRARDGKVTREDMLGGAITISNAGMFNITYMTPIINPPQSAILGIGSIRQLFRPDENGSPSLKQEMGLVLAADHRLHDGNSGALFLNHVIELLQDPYRLLRRSSFNKG